MIISNEKKFIILKNPKTAGTSLHKTSPFDSFATTAPGIYMPYLMMNCADIKNCATDVVNAKTEEEKYNVIVTNKFNIYGNYQYYIDLHGLMHESDSPDFCTGDILTYDCYVVVRDPIKRFKSMCKHAKSRYGIGLVYHLFEDEFQNNMTENDMKIIDDRVYFTSRKPPNSMNPVRNSMFSKFFQKHWDSYTISDIADRLLDVPFTETSDSSLIRCPEFFNVYFLRIPQSYYCRDERVQQLDFANINSELAKLCSRYNLRYSKLESHNTSPAEKIPEVFSDAILNKVKKTYAEDIEIYTKLITDRSS